MKGQAKTAEDLLVKDLMRGLEDYFLHRKEMEDSRRDCMKQMELDIMGLKNRVLHVEESVGAIIEKMRDTEEKHIEAESTWDGICCTPGCKLCNRRCPYTYDKEMATIREKELGGENE